MTVDLLSGPPRQDALRRDRRRTRDRFRSSRRRPRSISNALRASRIRTRRPSRPCRPRVRPQRTKPLFGLMATGFVLQPSDHLCVEDALVWCQGPKARMRGDHLLGGRSGITDIKRDYAGNYRYGETKTPGDGPGLVADVTMSGGDSDRRLLGAHKSTVLAGGLPQRTPSMTSPQKAGS